MAGKGRITVLILVIAAFAVAGCSSPVGSIGQGAGVYKGLRVEYRKAWKIEETFKRKEKANLSLFRIDGEKQELIDQKDYAVYIFNDTDDIPATLEEPDPDLEYTFKVEREMIILVVYNKRSIPCPITVSNKDGDTSGIISFEWPVNH